MRHYTSCLCGRRLFDVQVLTYWTNFGLELLQNCMNESWVLLFTYWKLKVYNAKSNTMFTFMRCFMDTRRVSDLFENKKMDIRFIQCELEDRAELFLSINHKVHIIYFIFDIGTIVL